MLDKEKISDLILQYAQEVGEQHVAHERAVKAITVDEQTKWTRQSNGAGRAANTTYMRILHELGK